MEKKKIGRSRSSIRIRGYSVTAPPSSPEDGSSKVGKLPEERDFAGFYASGHTSLESGLYGETCARWALRIKKGRVEE